MKQEVVIFDGDDTHHQDLDDLKLWKDWIDARRGWEWNRWNDRSVADLLDEPLREGA